MSSEVPDPPQPSGLRGFWSRRSKWGKAGLIAAAVFVALIAIAPALPEPDEPENSAADVETQTTEPATTEQAEATTDGTTREATTEEAPAEETDGDTQQGPHGSVEVTDRRGDTPTAEIDIVRGTLTLSQGTFIGTITTAKPIKSYWDGVGADVTINDAGGEDWTIWGQWEPETDLSGQVIGGEATCEAIKDVDFEHPHRCEVRFHGRQAIITFKASLLPDDGDPIEVQFTTAVSHETDVVPDDQEEESVWAELVVVE